MSSSASSSSSSGGGGKGKGGAPSSSLVEAKKRLMRDLKEMMENPLENVSAAPLESNMFVWHANLRGVAPLDHTFHFILEFPASYPLDPPQILLCTPLPHPNVMASKKGPGYTLCLDITQSGQWEKELDKNVLYSGWSTAYTVLSMLVQLQAFILDTGLQYATNKGHTLEESIAKARAFKCASCTHTPSNLWPIFPTKQQLDARNHVRKISFKPRARSEDSHMHFIPVSAAAKRANAATATAAPYAALLKSTQSNTAASVPNTTPSVPTKAAASTSTPAVAVAPAAAPAATSAATSSVATSASTSSSADKRKPKVVEDQWITVRSKRSRVAPPSLASNKSKTLSLTKASKVVYTPSKAAVPAPLSPKKQAPVPIVSVQAKKAKKQANEFAGGFNMEWRTTDFVSIMLADAEAREQRMKLIKEKEKIEMMRMVKASRTEASTKTKKDKHKRKAAAAAAAAAATAAETPITPSTAASLPANAEVNKVADVVSPSKKGAKRAKKGSSTSLSTSDAAESVQAVKADKPIVVKSTPAPVPSKPASVVDAPQKDQWEDSKQRKQKQPVVEKPVKAAKVEEPATLYVSPAQVIQSTKINYEAMGNLSVFPFDIFIHILSYLDVPNLSNVALVSRDMHSISENGLLWKELFSRYYPRSKLSAASLGDWKYVFMREVNHIVDELVCFHTKLTFEEDVLGVPIVFTVNPVTQRVDYISSTMDIISYTAFHEYNVRRTPYKEVFSHWLPLYITEDHFQRALPHIKKTMVQLSPEYRSASFDASMALEVLPKLMNTMIVMVMNGGLHASSKALNGYCAFHRLLLAFVELYPDLARRVNKSVEDFIKFEDYRVKSNLPSLGNWLPLLTVSNKYTWYTVAKLFVEESMDRNVIWICKEFPQLANLQSDPNSSDKFAETGVELSRLNQSFEASQVSLKLILFHVYFLTKIARTPGVSLAKIADNYDRFYGRPSSKMQDDFQKAIKNISTMSKWQQFFYFAALPCPSPAALTLVLRQCVRNSKKKGYHNDKTNFRNIQASGTSVILKKGDSYTADKSLERVVMGLGWGYEKGIMFLDATCFECGKNGEILESMDYQNTNNNNGSVVHSGDQIDPEKQTVEHEINITLNKLRPETTTLVFTITAWQTTLASAKLPWVRLSDAETKNELCRYVLENTGDHIAVIMCVMRRNTDASSRQGWRVDVVGKFDSGRAPTYSPLAANITKMLQEPHKQ